jgi:hypothetical protein
MLGLDGGGLPGELFCREGDNLFPQDCLGCGCSTFW